MTTTYPFVPNIQAPFQFNPTLDGTIYAATVKFNWSGQRWFIELDELTGDEVFNLPLIGSTNAVAAQSASWAFGTATVVTELPHNLLVYATVPLVISGFTPAGYNGVVQAFIVDNFTVQYPLATDPGAPSGLGSVDFSVNIAAGYFTTSRLVYRESNNTFEVSP